MTKKQFIHLVLTNIADPELSNDYLINYAKTLANDIEKVEPFDEKPEKKEPAAPKKTREHIKWFREFPWPKDGARRIHIDAYLRAVSGYTSNRAMQTIINNALEEELIIKDKDGYYFPGKNLPTA